MVAVHHAAANLQRLEVVPWMVVVHHVVANLQRLEVGPWTVVVHHAVANLQRLEVAPWIVVVHHAGTSQQRLAVDNLQRQGVAPYMAVVHPALLNLRPRPEEAPLLEERQIQQLAPLSAICGWLALKWASVVAVSCQVPPTAIEVLLLEVVRRIQEVAP